MNGPMRKDLFRSIKKSLTRFISIVAIIALGISFFVGMKSASPNMRETADEYFYENNLMDIEVYSTIGFTSEEISDISAVDGVHAASGVKYSDTLIFVGDTGLVNATNGAAMSCRVMGMDFDEAKKFSESGTAEDTYMNRVKLIDGRFPEKANECLIDYSAAKSYSDLAIGNNILLSGDETNIEDKFNKLTYKIVGYVSSPMYISLERGTTSIASGTLGMFMYIDENCFTQENYTSAFITIENKENYSVYSEEYTEIVEKIGKEIESISVGCIDARLANVKAEYEQKIEDGEKTYDELEKVTTKQLEEALAKIDDIQHYIDTGGSDIEKEKKELDSRVSAAEERLEASKENYDDSKKKYEEDKNDARDKGNQLDGLSKAKQIYQDYLKKQNSDRQDIDKLIANLETYKSKRDTAKAAWDKAESELQSKNTEISSVERDLKSAQKSLDGYKKDKEEWTEESYRSIEYINSRISEYEKKCKKYNDQLSTLKSESTQLESDIESAKKDYNNACSDIEDLEATIKEREETYSKNQKILNGYAEDIKRLNEGQEALTIFKNQLSQSEQALLSSKIAITESQLRLYYEKSTGNKKITASEADLKAAKTRLEKAEKEYSEIEHDVKLSLEKAKGTVESDKLFLSELNSSVWVVSYQNDLPGHESYGQSLDNINAIANVFPVFFFVIAAFICLATMTRMVQEERMQLGTLKALGFSNGKILKKYYYYAGFACASGAIIGSVLGSLIFPKAVSSAYGMIYNIPSVKISFNWLYIIIGTVFAFAVTLTATSFACRSELKVHAAHLMRPKAPLPGKRIFIERFTTIWESMSFGSIVTMRNMFRNKRRMIMTILGVASCTTLILSAFGLSNSVDKIISAQYDEGGITKYDIMVTLDEAQIPNESEMLKQINNDIRVKKGMLLVAKTMTASSSDEANDTELTAHIIIPEDASKISDFYNLKSRKNHSSISLTDEGVVVSEKLAKDTDTKVGSTLKLKSIKGEEYEVKVSAIAENYLDHYIYFSPAYYAQITGESPEYKNIIIDLENYAVEGDEQNLADDLLSYTNVTGIASTDIMIESFNSVIDRLDVVIIIFIVTAGLLALIILYNLTNISVQERLREIATIKILGFSDREITSYVYRENIFHTAAGIILGLAGGKILHMVIINLAEVNIAMFGRDIYWWSYLLTVLITASFSAAVCVLVHKKLKNMDTLSAMKSVE